MLVENRVRLRVELAPLVAVGLVRKSRTHHAVGDVLSAHSHRQLRFELRELLGVLAGEVAEVALAGETPQLAHACAAVHRQADRFDLVELCQVRVALVDRRQVERLLQPGVVEVELLVELGDEPVRLFAIGVQLPVRGRGGRHCLVGYAAVQEIRVKTERRTQLVDITRQVQEAIASANGAAAALVYVPHTTAAITINEGADPAVAQDLESALEKVVDDGWDWKHVEDPDGPNAPSHIRASLISPHILVPLADGKLALGQWQGIFFCEFDGPRERKVYVTPLS